MGSGGRGVVIAIGRVIVLIVGFVGRRGGGGERAKDNQTMVWGMEVWIESAKIDLVWAGSESRARTRRRGFWV
jgi:hypothetical protein